MSMLLSEHYGKNIRQGNSFTITGVQVYLRPHNDGATDDFDVGGSALLQCAYLPTTNHSRKAWNQAFKMWNKQRSLYTVRGIHPVRNEDFELAWNYDNRDTNRTSQMLQSITDGAGEYVCLNGDSTQGSDWVLSDYYNTTNKPEQRTQDHFTGALYKNNKYGDTKFPPVDYFATTGSASSIVTKFDSVGTNTYFSGGDFDAEWNHFPVPLNILCGLIKYDAYLIPGDTAAQIEDNVDLFVSFAVKKWKPLVIRPKKKKMKKFTRRKSSGRRFSRKRSRR